MAKLGILKISGYTVTSWAEPMGAKWQGLASVSPKIRNTWAGGPQGDSLVCDGLHDTPQAAEQAALKEASVALAAHLNRLLS